MEHRSSDAGSIKRSTGILFLGAKQLAHKPELISTITKAQGVLGNAHRRGFGGTCPPMFEFL